MYNRYVSIIVGLGPDFFEAARVLKSTITWSLIYISSGLAMFNQDGLGFGVGVGMGWA